jgi:hypothetical protein
MSDAETGSDVRSGLMVVENGLLYRTQLSAGFFEAEISSLLKYTFFFLIIFGVHEGGRKLGGIKGEGSLVE